MPSNNIDSSKVQWDAPHDNSAIEWDAPAQTAGGAQTVGGAAQAGASGLNAGSADLLGLPIDTARNILELTKAGLGFGWHEATGKSIPDALQPNETPDVGSSTWIKEKLRNIGSAVDVAQDTTLNRYLHAGTEVVPSALAGNEGGTVGAVRAAGAGAVTGAAQQGASDIGLDPVSQSAIGILAGHAASRIAPKLSAPVRGIADPVAPTKFEPGDAPKIQIGGESTAADQLRQGVPLPEITAPTPEGTESPALPDMEHNQRANTLRAIGLKEARESAITGDTKAAGTDFQTSKVDGDIGDRMAEVIDKERAAQQSFAGRLADAAGGTRGMDQADLYNRGSVIAKPIEQLADHFDAKIKDAYAAASTAAGTAPIETPATGGFMKNERAQFLSTVEGKQLREGVMARMRDLGMMDEDGNGQPASIQQIERLRQFVGDAYTPRTGKLISNLKSALDEDVTKAAGKNVYANARAARTLRATLLDDPTGIAKLAAPEDRLGINRSVPLEHIPDYLQKLPVDQFSHVIKTLRDVPAEVQPAASAALNEIRSHFANSVEKAGNSTQGMWHVKAANGFLNQNQLRMAEVFSPKEMDRFKTLADAGSILRMDRTYPGAAAQSHNLMMSGALKSTKVIKKIAGVAGTVAGAAHGGVGGPNVGNESKAVVMSGGAVGGVIVWKRV